MNATRTDPSQWHATAHIQVWRELASAQRRSHCAEAALLKDRIAELEQEPRTRPKEIVERYVDRDELDGARAKAERAFRSRENAWQASARSG